MSVQSFTTRLDNINETQDSINALSTYMILNDSLFDQFINVWKTHILRADSSRKLLLLYLCNDVVQKAKRQNKSRYLSKFSDTLLDIINPTYHAVDVNIKKKISRLISVWEDRFVFETETINNLKDQINKPAAKEPVISQPEAQVSTITPELKHINDLFQHINQLTDISQGNLTQLGIQSKTYLNLESDNLPKTQVHLNKLNVLEKLSMVSISNVEKIKSTREDIKNSVESLLNVINDGIKTDNTKIAVIRDKINKIKEVRAALSGELKNSTEQSNNNDGNNDKDREIEEQLEEEDDDELPKYENQDSESDDEIPSKRRKLSPSPSAKKVAFSENIEINEFEHEHEHENEEAEAEEFEEKDDLKDGDDEEMNDVSDSVQQEEEVYSKEETPSVMDLLKKLV
ncbi:RTT103 [Candida pseudojiufengensis]|uniref:RTT103 n=1 Tax=Candida pseudojiufengensis TaxID=497109 RepID=UPI002224C7E7|nr:RTT103 [Candida pseudojiufengensis]KAI5961817.1 RTT103 [Candida pseudojiufengensis]